MSTARHYRSILGVQEGASEKEIKKAYQRLAMKHHPDRGGDEAEFKAINEAYDNLKKKGAVSSPGSTKKNQAETYRRASEREENNYIRFSDFERHFMDGFNSVARPEEKVAFSKMMENKECKSSWFCEKNRYRGSDGIYVPVSAMTQLTKTLAAVMIYEDNGISCRALSKVIGARKYALSQCKTYKMKAPAR